MKKEIFIVFLVIILIIFILIFFHKGIDNNLKNENIDSSNSITSNNDNTLNNLNNNNTIPEDNNFLEDDERSIENVKMEIKKDTLNKTGATIIIRDSNINPFVYSEWFRIDKKVNNNWEKLKIINDKHSFSAVAYNIDNTGKFERAIDWSDLYGSLDKGTYKLIKNVYDNEGNEIYFSVEFDIVE